MALGRPLKPLTLSDEVRAQLESMARSRSLPHAHVRRAKIVLMSDEGLTNQQIGQHLGLSGVSVGKGRRRFCEQGLMGLYDELRPGGPRSISDEEVAALIHKTLEHPPKGATHWTCRSLAAEANLSKSTVQRVWKALGLQPHRQKHFKLSNDPFFCGQSQRHRRPLPEPSGQGHGVMRRREEPDPGPGTDAADSAFGPGLCGRRYAQLYPARHHDLVRGARNRIGQGPDPMQTPASAPGIPAVPQIHGSSGESVGEEGRLRRWE